MPDAYLSFGADPSHDADVRYLTADAVGIARLRRSTNMEGEWVLSSVAPVSFEAADQDEAERNAIGWVEANADEVLGWMEETE
jgi:hypothetical protein